MDKRTIEEIRKRREKECFAFCDRAAWYDELPLERKIEVRAWRKAWLDATKTGIIPDKPAWMK